MARRLPELELIHAAFSRGELSYAKVRALTRVATAENEQELLELASFMTAAQLERSVRAYRRVTTEEACEQQEDAYLSVFWEPDGSLAIHGRLAPEDGALLLRALDAMRDARWKERPRFRGTAAGQAGRRTQKRSSQSPRPRSPPRTRAAQAASATRSSSTSTRPCSPDDGAGGCELEDGSALSPETARRLACDASVVRNGRKTRTIPPALRRALRARDRGCRFPGCENRRFLDAHHVHHWARGGETTADNLVLLCRRHHRLVHEGGWHVDRRLRFHNRWGHAFPAVPRLPRGHPDELVACNRDLEIDAGTCEPGTGEALDLADAVDALLTISALKQRNVRITPFGQ